MFGEAFSKSVDFESVCVYIYFVYISQESEIRNQNQNHSNRVSDLANCLHTALPAVFHSSTSSSCQVGRQSVNLMMQLHPHSHALSIFHQLFHQPATSLPKLGHKNPSKPSHSQMAKCSTTMSMCSPLCLRWVRLLASTCPSPSGCLLCVPVTVKQHRHVPVTWTEIAAVLYTCYFFYYSLWFCTWFHSRLKFSSIFCQDLWLLWQVGNHFIWWEKWNTFEIIHGNSQTQAMGKISSQLSCFWHLKFLIYKLMKEISTANCIWIVFLKTLKVLCQVL